MRLNPHWNSMFAFEGIGSVFSIVRVNLKCMVDNLHSCGNSVDKITACFIVKRLLSVEPSGICKTIFTYVPFRGKPSSIACAIESL